MFAELTTITLGATVWYMSDQVDDIAVGATTFTTQEGLSHGDIKDGLDPITLMLPADHAFVQMYRTVPPSSPATVLIQFLDTEDNPGSLRVLYKGWAKSIRFVNDGQEAEVYVDSVVTAFETRVADEIWCIPCRVPLFGSRCSLDRELFKYEGTVTDVTGNTITVGGLLAAEGAGWALPGTIKFGDEWRQIFAQDGDVLTMGIPFAEDPLGETVSVYAGCDHSITECDTKFDNVVNYRGFAYTPDKNVFITGIQ